MSGVVVIQPRDNVEARIIAAWLVLNFQTPGDVDHGSNAVEKMAVVGGNPLVNARVMVAS